MSHFVFLSGPSGVGKGPLWRAFRREEPQQARESVGRIVLYTSRAPRAGERDGIDYHFRTRKDIKGLKGRDDHVVFPVRSDLQALSLAELDSAIKQPGPGFLEVFYTAVAELKGNPRFQGVDVKTVFLSPLTEDELSEIRYRVSQERAPSVEEVVTALMREKLINRTIREKGALPANDLPNIEERARSAIEEMRSAHLYDYVLPNHDGEDSPNWGASMAFGDAARTLGSFTQIMLRFVEGGPEIYAEQWRPGAVSEPPPPKPVEH